MSDELVLASDLKPERSGEIILFEDMQRIAKVYAASEFVPQLFQKNMAHCYIAVSMAQRLGADPMAVMQEMYVVHGKPSWSSKFVISCINTCGKFSQLRYHMDGDEDDKWCYAWAIEKASGDKLEGPPASIAMAKKEGWWSRKDKYGNETSKWQTMPDLMLQYRAATFFGRLYCPEILMGMRTQDELEDMRKADARVVTKPNFDDDQG